jgi:hypothetical protein
MDEIGNTLKTESRFHFGISNPAIRPSLSSEQFQESLRHRWPQAKFLHTTPPDGPVSPFLTFGFTDRDIQFYGIFAADPHAALSLHDIIPDHAALFLAWYQALFPADAALEFTSDYAVSYGFNDRTWPLPRQGTQEQIRNALVAHLTEVLAD